MQNVEVLLSRLEEETTYSVKEKAILRVIQGLDAWQLAQMLERAMEAEVFSAECLYLAMEHEVAQYCGHAKAQSILGCVEISEKVSVSGKIL